LGTKRPLAFVGLFIMGLSRAFANTCDSLHPGARLEWAPAWTGASGQVCVVDWPGGNRSYYDQLCSNTAGKIAFSGDRGSNKNTCVFRAPSSRTVSPPSDHVPSRQADLFGAVAVSTSTLSWGSAKNYRSRAEAEAAALQGCRRHASDCQVGSWVMNGCVALATGRSFLRTHWSSSHARNQTSAENSALADCNSRASCSIAISECSGG